MRSVRGRTHEKKTVFICGDHYGRRFFYHLSVSGHMGPGRSL